MASVLDWFRPLLGGGDPEAQAAAQNSMAMQPSVLDHLQGVLSDVSSTPSYYDPSRSARENALDPRGIEQATNVALSIGPGALRPRATSTVAGKGVQQANPEVAAPQIGLG